MEFGIFSLFAVQFLLSFLAFTAWRAIASEAGRIKDAENRMSSKVDALDAAVSAATEAAKAAAGAAMAEAVAAKAEAQSVRGSHFDTLLRRIDSAEASTLGFTKQVEVLADKVASLGGRLSNFARVYKRQDAEEKEPAPAPGPNGVEQLDLAQLAPQVVPGHFGRKVGKG